MRGVTWARRCGASALVTAIVLLGAPAISCATTLLQLGMPELAERADLILEATVTDAHSVALPLAPGLFTDAALTPITYYKGRPDGAAVRLLLPGGRLEGRSLAVEGMPTLHPGARVLLFLEALPAAASPDGAPRYTILGMWQGHLALSPSGDAFTRDPRGVLGIAPAPLCTGGELETRFDAAPLRRWLQEAP